MHNGLGMPCNIFVRMQQTKVELHTRSSATAEQQLLVSIEVISA